VVLGFAVVVVVFGTVVVTGAAVVGGAVTGTVGAGVGATGAGAGDVGGVVGADDVGAAGAVVAGVERATTTVVWGVAAGVTAAAGAAGALGSTGGVAANVVGTSMAGNVVVVEMSTPPAVAVGVVSSTATD
jgi:hypothetical protein